MSDRPPQHALNASISCSIPRQAWDSTVTIVGAKQPRAGHVATGTLFQVADAQFVVTAGHAIRGMVNDHVTLALGQTGADRLIVPHTEWMTTTPRGEDDSSDPLDIAVTRLSPEVAARMNSTSRFLRTSDVTDADPGPRAVYCLFGFPGIWAQPIRSESNDEFSVKRLEFTTYAHVGDVAALIGYDVTLHLLLAGDSENVTTEDGLPAVITDRLGQSAAFPRILKGASGCSVWHIGDLDVPVADWGSQPASVVGIQTAIYQAAGVIKVARWTVVTTLIHSAFPDLRPALALWR